MRWTGLWILPAAATAIALACSGMGDPSAKVETGDEEFARNVPPVTDGGDPGEPGWPPPPINIKKGEGWEFFGPEQGGPGEVFGVSSDESGNVWVAGGKHGLFLLAPGATAFERFTVADGLRDCTDATGAPQGCAVISVAGGPANTVFVGYRGVHGDRDEYDPEWMRKSGDADKVLWKGGRAIEIAARYDISGEPGYYEDEPDLRREKVRDVYRILYDKATGNVWFGGNHGVAMYEARTNRVREHQHAMIWGYHERDLNNGTELSGEWYGVGLDAQGDLWMGGGHRVARLPYATRERFDATLSPEIDVWPDLKCRSALPTERTDDLVSDLVVEADGTVWVGSTTQGLARIDPPAPPPAADAGTPPPPVGADAGVPTPTGEPDAGVPTPTGEPDAGVPTPPTCTDPDSYAPLISHVNPSPMVVKSVTSLEIDPKDRSIWVGHIWGGITRIQGGTYRNYGLQLTNGVWRGFGGDLIEFAVPDIQSDMFQGSRRLLVAFNHPTRGGAIGIYTGQ